MSRGEERARQRASQLVAGGAETRRKPDVEPLRCPTCGAPVPLGSADVAICGSCRTEVPIPESLRALRTSERRDTADRAEAEALYKKLGKPPGPLLRGWVTFTELAGGAVAGIAYVILSISAVFMFLAGFAIAFLSHGIAGLIRIDVVERFGGFKTYAGVVILLGVFVAFPMWLRSYLETSGELRKTLQANLAAHAPARPGFPSTCRLCGAALDIPSNAYGVRCDYCQADNLVTVPEEVVAAARRSGDDFHGSIVEANGRARALRADARKGVPSASGICLVVALVFGLLGKACVWVDVEDTLPTFSESMGPPRIMVPSLDPQHPIPIATEVHSALENYTVALHHGEVLELRSGDDGWCTRTEIHNTTTFPFLTREWDVTWSPQLDGANAARFRAPYTGLFRLEIKGLDYHGSPHTDSHFAWRIGAHSNTGAPPAPAMTIEDAPAERPLLGGPAQALASKLGAPLVANPPDRPDLLVAVDARDPSKAVLYSVASEQRIFDFEEKPAVIALAFSNDGHHLVTASTDFLSVWEIPDDLEHIKDKLGWFGMLCDLQPTAVGFLDAHTFAIGDAAGAIVVHDIDTGLVRYALPKGPGAVTALAMSADGLVLTATYGATARKFVVANARMWSDNTWPGTTSR